MATEQRFILVPDGSTLELDAQAPAAGVRLSADLIAGGAIRRSWSHQQLLAGTSTAKLNAADSAYTVQVVASFTTESQATAQVTATIQRPPSTGGTHSVPKDLTFQGKRPATVTGRVRIAMRKVQS